MDIDQWIHYTASNSTESKRTNGLNTNIWIPPTKDNNNNTKFNACNRKPAISHMLDYNVCNRLHASYCYRQFVCNAFIYIFGFWFYNLVSLFLSISPSVYKWLCMHFVTWTETSTFFDVPVLVRKWESVFVCTAIAFKIIKYRKVL